MTTQKHVPAPVASRRPVLILVNGAPGAGKTTLARRLGADLGITQIGRDDLKEFLFDKIGIGDREWSSTLGRITSDSLYHIIENVLESKRDLIVENAYYVSFARPRLSELIAKFDVPCVEIYCQLDAKERRRRFIERNENGTRHIGHLDAENYDASDEAIDQEKYAPLAVSELWKVDTTHFKEPEYKELLRKLDAFLNEQS